ncbi:hypothetical protein [Vibrio owensii]|uniref:hypothetical protein n=1 Tax=Vibrio owensii TaxID=696485 RepID=UPI0018F18254|nr:hypothetical protein [Vibrio owensii]
MTVNVNSHKVFLKYAEDSEIETLAEMHPQKTMRKGFALAMNLYKANRVNDNKHHRIVKRALELLGQDESAQKIINVFIERAAAAENGNTQPATEDASAQETQPVTAEPLSTLLTGETNPQAQNVSVSIPTKKVIFSGGIIKEARRIIIQPEELDQYSAADANRRNKKALTAASVADILPSARETGIYEEIYTFINEQGEKKIAEGTRRHLAGTIAKIAVPTWEFLEPLTDTEVAELSRKSDEAKRQHSLRENAIALENVCKAEGFTSMSQLLKFYDVTNTDTNRTAYRRAMSPATLSESLLAMFKDYEALSLRRIGDLTNIQKDALPEETKKQILTLRRDLNTEEIRNICDPIIQSRLEEIDEHFNELVSPQNVARRLADTVIRFSNSKDAIVPLETLKSAIEEHSKPKCEYDPKGVQIKLRKVSTELMLTYLNISDLNEEREAIEPADLKNTIEEFLALCDKNVTAIISAYNDDMFKLIKRYVPLKKGASKNDNQSKSTAETLFSNGVSEITLSEVTTPKGKVDLSFTLSGITEEQKKEFITMATEHFKSKLQIEESPTN